MNPVTHFKVNIFDGTWGIAMRLEDVSELCPSMMEHGGLW